ncbi:MAG TPA: histidine phosphotransferase family protein [Xanthobacteraceae bacterium]|jgi:histidine phosphotransferase ChpT|nr:histidine phosphotransferase family protein [Xanthobacteraceae bacterium]
MSLPAATSPATGAAPVVGPVTIGALDLAALLCSRVCHDLISPVGAIVNGLEVLEEDKDEETRTFALDLIKKSARQASAKLQFCRLAFGAAGSAGAQIETGDAEKVARGLIEDGKTTIVWNLPRELVAKNRVKLVLNMVLVACSTIPRGGTVTVGAADGGYRVAATGLNARLTTATAELLAGSPAQPVDAHAIQPVYTGILARDCGLTVSTAVEGEAVVVAAR